jgi:hypothetical protein
VIGPDKPFDAAAIDMNPDWGLVTPVAEELA